MPKAHDSIVDQMSKGLNQALGDHPELTGTLQRSNEARRVIIKRTSNDDVPLHIFDGSNQLPSAMATLLISRRLLLNTASATSHQVVDSMSWDSFFTTWAAYSRARAMSDPDGHYVQPETSAPGMRMRGTISQHFVGSCVTLCTRALLLVSEALGDRALALPLLAAVMRANTAAVTAEYYRGPDAAGGRDAGAALQRPQHANHDFDFVLPTELHWPEMGFENFFFLLPSRATTGARAGEAELYPDEGLEVTFGMEKSCFARHEKDAELLQFCENGCVQLNN
ncbi:hypothetical protein M0657_010399 [Pyricularia oryzae]|nr:hypothetical protein M9X92_010633 [Pyricularia oryzae]KAI7912597.1 hypothetical protein M0657_010399 [Pyricularia oryzae]